MKFERRSLFSSLPSEDRRSLIISTKYDYVSRVKPWPKGAKKRSSSRLTYVKVREAVSSVLNLLGGRPLEEPLGTKQLDKKPGVKGFNGPFKAHGMSGRRLLILPVYLISKTSGGDYHKGDLRRFVKVSSRWKVALLN